MSSEACQITRSYSINSHEIVHYSTHSLVERLHEGLLAICHEWSSNYRRDRDCFVQMYMCYYSIMGASCKISVSEVIFLLSYSCSSVWILHGTQQVSKFHEPVSSFTSALPHTAHHTPHTKHHIQHLYMPHLHPPHLHTPQYPTLYIYHSLKDSARKSVEMYLGLLRLPQYQTDIVITYNLPADRRCVEALNTRMYIW